LSAQEKDDTDIFKNTYHIIYFKKLATLNELAIIKSKTKEEIYILKHVILKNIKFQEIGDNKFLIGKGIISKKRTDWQANKTVMIKWDLVTSIVGFNNFGTFNNLTRKNPELELGN
jgi:hypothetical protein